MSLIHVQFVHNSGLNYSSKGKWQQINIVPCENGYIQILNTGSMHWICVADMTSGKSSNQVYYILDSLFFPKNTAMCDSPNCCIFILSRKWVNNPCQARLFSIAFEAGPPFGIDPFNSTYHLAALRPHLIKWLTSGRFAPFPKIEPKQVVRFKSSTHVIEIFCSCRTSWTGQRSYNYDMAKFCMCSEWYHKQCEKISLIVFHDKQKMWFCRGCKDQSAAKRIWLHRLYI